MSESCGIKQKLVKATMFWSLL